MSIIEQKTTGQHTPQAQTEREAQGTGSLALIEATQAISRADIARQLVRDRVVDQRQENQLYQHEWSPSETQHGSSRRPTSGTSLSSTRIDEAREQLTQFLAQRNVKRQRGSLEERELKRLSELYGEATESLLHLRLVRRGAKGSSLLESSQDEFAHLVEKPKEGTDRVAPLELGASEAPAAGPEAPVGLVRRVTVQKHEPATGKVTPENSRAALQALMADIAAISVAPRRR